MRFKIQTTVLLFVLLGTVSACNTFKDEIAPDSYMEVPKQLDGKWQLKTVVRNGTDISEVMDFSQFRVLHQFLFQRTRELVIPDDSQSDSHVPVPYTIVILVQSDG